MGLTKKTYLNKFQSFPQAILSYWKEVTGQHWGKVLVWVRKVCCGYWWMIVTFEWIMSNFLKLFTIFPHRDRCWKMVSHNGVFFVQDISRSKSWVSNECYGFLFWECRYKKKKFRLGFLFGHSYVSLNVTQHDLSEVFVIFLQRHLLAFQPNFIECVKRILDEFGEFCNNVVYFMICYSFYEVSSLHPIFSIFSTSTFMYHEMIK